MARNVLNNGWRYQLQGGSFRSVLKLEQFQAKKTAGDVLLRMDAAPITHLDLDQVRGLYGKVTAPTVAGLTGVGTVAEAAGGFKEGDKAVLAGGGSWASYATADPTKLIKVPSDMPTEYASIMAVGPMAAYQILKASGLQAGEVMVLNGADSLLGMCLLQLAKAWGINAVGTMTCTPGSELKLEKLKQMGLNVVSDPILDVSQVFGADLPKFAVSLAGGQSSAYLARLLAEDGKMVICAPASDEPQIIPNNKGITVQAFSPVKQVQGSEEMVAEIADLMSSHALKASIIRHGLSSAYDAIDQACAASQQVVLMHQGSAKTWADKSHDTYMMIEEQLQGNWNASAAAQDPYLKSGREQPWELANADTDAAFLDGLTPELKAKLAAVKTEEELLALLQSLNFAEKQKLGLPSMEALTLSAEELKAAVSGQ